MALAGRAGAGDALDAVLALPGSAGAAGRGADLGSAERAGGAGVRAAARAGAGTGAGLVFPLAALASCADALLPFTLKRATTCVRRKA